MPYVAAFLVVLPALPAIAFTVWTGLSVVTWIVGNLIAAVVLFLGISIMLAMGVNFDFLQSGIGHGLLYLNVLVWFLTPWLQFFGTLISGGGFSGGSFLWMMLHVCLIYLRG